MTSPASIQPILAVKHHPNADLLDIVKCLGFEAIVKRDVWKVGDLICYIQPDTVLPDKSWSAFYRAKSNRVKAIRLRGAWSQGIVESLTTVEYVGPVESGRDISTDIGVTEYNPPQPQDPNASGPYGYGIPKTDEERVENLDTVPYGEKVDVTLKIDGQSWTSFIHWDCGEWTEGVGGRSFLYKPDSDSHFTRNARKLDVFNKLRTFCVTHEIGLNGIALRGEQYGQGIQKGKHNPHASLPVSVALFSTWLIDERKYATKGHPLYIHTIAPELGLPTVPMLEKDVILTPELIKRYAEELEQVNGQLFEGVVINHEGGSFKVINLAYDSKK